jgi:hypothetical protein
MPLCCCICLWWCDSCMIPPGSDVVRSSLCFLSMARPLSSHWRCSSSYWARSPARRALAIFSSSVFTKVFLAAWDILPTAPAISAPRLWTQCAAPRIPRMVGIFMSVMRSSSITLCVIVSIASSSACVRVAYMLIAVHGTYDGPFILCCPVAIRGACLSAWDVSQLTLYPEQLHTPLLTRGGKQRLWTGPTNAYVSRTVTRTFIEARGGSNDCGQAVWTGP